jgi:hypothetical protein
MKLPQVNLRAIMGERFAHRRAIIPSFQLVRNT